MRHFSALLLCLAMTACQKPSSLPDSGALEVDHAVLLRGPGAAPRPGSPPFEPSFSASLRIRGGLPEGATVWLKLLEEAAVEPWQREGAVNAVQARVEQGPEGRLLLRATFPPGGAPRAPRVGLELRRGSQVLGRCTAPLEEQFLPAGPPAGGRDLR